MNTTWNFDFKTSKKDILFQFLIVSILIFNILDGIGTIFVVGTERAYEANPAMAFLLEIHPIVFMIGKILLVSVGMSVMWKYRNYVAAKIGIVLMFLVYFGVMIMHIESAKIFLEYISK